MTKEESNNLDRNEINNSCLQYESSLSKTTNSPGFLVSFLVDARGGAMFGLRHSGVDIIIPPGKVCMPTRLTCRMVKRDKVPGLPSLSEEEAFVSRFVQVGPTNTTFIGPVLIEIPHFGSLQSRDREVVVMRSDDGKSWHKHSSPEPSETFLHFVKEATKDYPQNDKKLVTKIYTNVLPKYFVIISRVKQTTSVVDSKGALIQTSTASINLPQGAVTKETRVTLKVIPVEKDTITAALHHHDHHQAGLSLESSHIVSLEPRRRKFHQLVSVNVSVSKPLQDKMKGQKKGNRPPVLLLYTLSTTNSPAVWEDATELAPYTIYKDTVTFSTNVSARYWLLENHPTQDTIQIAKQAYQEATAVPFYACFHVLAKPLKHNQWQVRILCVDDMKVRQTMEMHDNFTHLASSDYVQVLNSMSYHVTLSGNLKASVALPGQLLLTYRPFRVSRLAFVASVVDSSSPVTCHVDVARGTGHPTTCSFDLTFPTSASVAEGEMGGSGGVEMAGDNWKEVHEEIRLKFAGQVGVNNSNEEGVRFVQVAELLKGDWVGLADHLGVGQEGVVKLQTEYGDANEQALLMLQLWMETTGGVDLSTLEAGLRKIGREDIIEQCLAPPTSVVNQETPVRPIDSSHHESLHGSEQCSQQIFKDEEMACDEEYTEEEVEEEVVRLGEDGEEVREKVVHKVRTLKKSPHHDAPEVKIIEVPDLIEDTNDA